MSPEEERGEMADMTDREFAAWKAVDGRRVAGCRLDLGMYGNKRGAIQAVDLNTGPECTVTVNIEEELGEGEFFVRFEAKKHSGHVFEGLEDCGIAKPTGRVVSSGFVKRYAEVWRLAMEGDDPC